MSHLLRWLFLPLVLVAIAQAQPAATQPAGTPPTDRRVVVISVDGFRPDLVFRARMPVVQNMVKTGTFTLWARTTEMSVTLPSHTSMVTGVAPKKHGVTWNGDLPAGEMKYTGYPTLMELAGKAGYTTAAIVGKTKFDPILKAGTVGWVYKPHDGTVADSVVADHAVEIITRHQPALLFVHFPNNDTVGHAKGWGSGEQLEALADTDKQIGRVVEALEAKGLRGRTLVIVTADHGGQGRSHGPNDPRSRHIPWIVTGPGVNAGYDLCLKGDLIVNIEDTFATACWWLGITPAGDLDGKPITAITDPIKPNTPNAR